MDMVLGLNVNLTLVSLFSVTYIVGLYEAIPMCNN